MNRRWYILYLFIFIWFFPSIVHCQVSNDSLVDVMPLAVGNQWTYRYYTDDVSWPEGNPGTITTDSGRVIYSISGCSMNTDSSIWQFHVQRDLKEHTNYSYYSMPDKDSISFIHDTSSFILIEQHTGQHQFYRIADPYTIRLDVFPFTKEYTDTTMIYRFRSVGIGDTTSFLSWISPVPGPDFKSTFTFQKGVGLIRNSYNSGTVDVYSINEHFLLSSIITSVQAQINQTLLQTFSLSQNYPNPFNPTTVISYRLATNSFVDLDIFDILGRKVETLLSERQSAGAHSVTFNTGGLSSGVYFYRLTAGNFVDTKKLMVIK